MMKTAKIYIIIVSAVLALPLIAEAASLGTVDIEHIGYGAKSLIKVWGGGFDGISIFGGVYMLNKSAGTGDGELWENGPLGAFCIEIPEGVPGSTTTYNIVMPEEAHDPPNFLGGPIGAEKAGYLAELWGKFFDPNWVGKGPFTSQQKNNAEAFAAAVWEIIYEDLPDSPAGWDVTVDGTDGDLGFRCANADTATANTWLRSLKGNNGADLRTFVRAGKQDFLTNIPIAEPVTIISLCLGGSTLLRRRKA